MYFTTYSRNFWLLCWLTSRVLIGPGELFNALSVFWASKSFFIKILCHSDIVTRLLSDFSFERSLPSIPWPLILCSAPTLKLKVLNQGWKPWIFVLFLFWFLELYFYEWALLQLLTNNHLALSLKVSIERELAKIRDSRSLDFFAKGYGANFFDGNWTWLICLFCACALQQFI